MGKDEVRVQGESMIVVPPDPKKDDRRHKVWCKYYENGTCFSPKNWAYYNNHCPGSKHCIYYKEDPRKKGRGIGPGPTPIAPPTSAPKPKPIPKYTVTDFEIGDIIECVDGWYGEIIEIKQNKNNTLAVVNCDNGKRKIISLNSYIRENRLEFV